jgi:hypothetical protein
MLGDLIQHALATRPEFEFVPQIGSLAEMPANLLWQQQLDLIVVGLRRRQDEGIVQAIHDLVPSALVVTIASDLKSAFVHRVGCKPYELLPFSDASLAAEIVHHFNRS